MILSKYYIANEEVNKLQLLRTRENGNKITV